MKGTVKDWLKIGILLLDEAAVIGLVVLVLWVLKIEIPLPVTIVVAVLLGVVIFIIHRAVMPTFHKKQVTGAQAMTGMDGEVVEALNPVGVIRTGSEYWKAKSIAENIAVGEEVEILGVDGLKLTVKPKSKSSG